MRPDGLNQQQALDALDWTHWSGRTKASILQAAWMEITTQDTRYPPAWPYELEPTNRLPDLFLVTSSRPFLLK